MDKGELTKKVHGLPLYAWIVIGGGTLGFLFFYMKRKTSNATPSADSSTQDVPANTDSSTTFDPNSGMPWGGGAPGGTYSGSDFTDAFNAMSEQEASDAASARDSLAAAIKQQQDDNQARQSDIINQNAQRLSDLQTLSAEYQRNLAAGNTAATLVASPKPLSAAQQAATAPQLGPGGTPAYLPTKTVAADAAKSTGSKVGKVGNSGIHAA